MTISQGAITLTLEKALDIMNTVGFCKRVSYVLIHPKELRPSIDPVHLERCSKANQRRGYRRLGEIRGTFKGKGEGVPTMKKKSTIKIEANVLKGIMEFREKSKTHNPSKYATDKIGFGMDSSKSKLVRYHVSDGAIGITGTVGEVQGDRLPSGGVALPPDIYLKGIRLGDELTLKIGHGGKKYLFTEEKA